MCGSSDADSPDLPLSRYLVGMGGVTKPLARQWCSCLAIGMIFTA